MAKWLAVVRSDKVPGFGRGMVELWSKIVEAESWVAAHSVAMEEGFGDERYLEARAKPGAQLEIHPRGDQ